MLISPPFLDGVSADPFDETYLDRLMPGTGDGFFPLSARLGWHGGIHLQAPRDAQGNAMPVRAIADGTVVLVRKPEREPSTPAEAVTKSKDENEPLGYDRGWTSNGAVVIKHTTDIGATGTTPVSVTFYSVYQHLHTIPTATEGKAIWRKDIVGTAGYIAGQQDRIHFEIVMDKANVDKLIGNSGLIGPKNHAPPTAGRTDSIWGSIYFYVPAGLSVYGVDPRTQTQPYIVKQGDTPDSIATAFNTTVAKLKKLNHHQKDSDETFTQWINSKIPPPPAPAPTGHAPHHHTPPPPTPITVPQRYGGAITAAPATPPANAPANPGSQAPANPPAAPAAPDPNPPLAPVGQSSACRIAMKLFKTSTMTTSSPAGAAVGTPVTESDVSEYTLFNVAEAFYPHCASAGYELLRFGRVIGPDALHPDDANLTTHRHEHFREANVLMPDGSAKKGFIDLNADGVTAFSEADFSATDEWLLVDDDSDGDARCDSPLVYGAMYAAYLNAHGGELANDVITAIHTLLTPKGQTAAAPAAASSTPSAPSNAAPAQPPSIASLISDPAVKARLSKIIAHSPSEWDKNLVDKRWAWLTDEKDAEALAAAQGDAAKKAATPTLQPNGTLTHPGYDKFVKHVQAVAFWDDGKIGLKSVDTWRFDPRQFIKMWRKCGWLSLDEMIGLMPEGSKTYAKMHSVLTTGQDVTVHGMHQIIPSNMYVSLNLTTRKYVLDEATRKAQFWGQIVKESDNLQTVTEYADGSAYEPSSPNPTVQAKARELGNTDPGDGAKFKGRGIIQSTGKTNYAAYGTYRNIDMTTGSNNLRFEQDSYVAADSAGLYWISRMNRDKVVVGGHSKWVLDGKINISRRADDSSFTSLTDTNGITASVSNVTKQVNAAQLGLADRANYFKHAFSDLSDFTESLTSNIRKP